MSEFFPFETVDYVATINQALQRVFEARSQVRDSLSFERYMRAVEALYVILLPRLRPKGLNELMSKARVRDEEFGFFTLDSLEALDKAVELIVESLDRNHLLIRGTTYREERL